MFGACGEQKTVDDGVCVPFCDDDDELSWSCSCAVATLAFDFCGVARLAFDYSCGDEAHLVVEEEAQEEAQHAPLLQCLRN